MSPKDLQIEVLAQNMARLERTNFLLKILSALLTLGLAVVSTNTISVSRAFNSLAPLTRSDFWPGSR